MDNATRSYLKWTTVATIGLAVLLALLSILVAWAIPGGWAPWRVGVIVFAIAIVSGILATSMGLAKGEQYHA